MNRTSIPALLVLFALIAGSGCMGFSVKPAAGTTTVVTTTVMTTTATPAPAPSTSTPMLTPTPEPDPYPDALALKEIHNFSSGKTLCEGTVYRYWINETYQLYVPEETRYITKSPAAGNKYLIIFVNTVNRGTARNIPVSMGNIRVHYQGKTYFADPTHELPKTQSNVDSPPEFTRIGEIQWFQKLSGSEYVEDFGYSHGMVLSYLTPGESNAIDGYITYEVPATLEPGKTYVEISFNPTDAAVWKLQ